jgi:hypothetical protein
MNKNNAILAMLLALAAAGASAQTTGATQGQPTTGETYRPSLDGQQTSTPAAPIDMRPMTQEEKATGRQEPSRLKDIDPATHPAPQNVRPQPTPKTQQEKGVQPTARRSVQQQIDSAARLAAPNAPAVVAPATSAPTPVVPTTTQVNGCVGATCVDATGATSAGAVGSSSVNSAGRLCNRSGTTVQCF